MPAPSRILCCVLVAAFTGLARSAPRRDTSRILPASHDAADSCPSLTDSTATTVPSDVVIHGKERVVPGTRYVSMLIDGQRATWNQLSYALGPQAGPELDTNDIERVEVVKPPIAQATYGTCPGVGLILITTKSKTWHPYTH